ncbi:polysaccharide deacetylase family protein [Nocardioides lianchengensis]|uniref:Polysaccharide deacetylase n=1 Tax=Nocardioides lianchengensis TaxID=1045774 RepID=A0A1G6VSE8_9ACTN|nr:polysaccharide deacetylase family protein [Nocardioides lianchengensis]NYG11280.1 peptidoglycan/xylan/chitin deacetylase (PgdA/CDA1 family) [Nocardioides lianchengensis]SDD56532.1 Polysaccharide deacetylase [Nocardioides lianchengensis]
MTTHVNLCFHGIGRPGPEREPGESSYWIGTDLFHRVLDLVADDPRVRLSFDDGNASDVEVALPALVERGLHATFFVLAGRLDDPRSLDADGVRLLQAHGMTVGTHGMDHRPWRGMDPATATRELDRARTDLAAVTGRPVEHAALPLGRYDRVLLSRLRARGYAGVHTSDRAWAREGAWLQPRFSLRATDTLEDLRHDVLRPPALPRRLRRELVGGLKRLR